MNRTILAALAVALMSSTAVVAADVNGRSSTKDATVNANIDKSWTGIWVGAFAGYGMSNTDFSLDHFNGEESKNRGHVSGLGGEGFIGEAQIGFDKQLNDRIVAGIYGGVSLSNSKSTAGISGLSAEIEEDLGYFGAARVGYLLNKDNMVYLGGGYRWMDADLTVTQGSTSETVGVDQEGFFGELGLESRLTDRLALRAFGRYTLLDETKYRDGDDDCFNQLTVEPAKFEAMLGITYKLGGGSWNFND